MEELNNIRERLMYQIRQEKEIVYLNKTLASQLDRNNSKVLRR